MRSYGFPVNNELIIDINSICQHFANSDISDILPGLLEIESKVDVGCYSSVYMRSQCSQKAHLFWCQFRLTFHVANTLN